MATGSVFSAKLMIKQLTEHKIERKKYCKTCDKNKKKKVKVILTEELMKERGWRGQKKDCVFSSIYLVGGRLAVCRARRGTGTAAPPLLLRRVPPA